jgi:ABC-type uncharacterized transport system involved in gliding motility auxiliary subunit
VVVVAGPQTDLLPPVVDALRRYVQGGGKLLALLEPAFEGDTEGLNALLGEWQFQVSKDVVIDVTPVGQLFGAGPLSPLAVEYPHHDITKDLRGLATVFPTARSVRAAEGGRVMTLAETTGESWAESDLALQEPVQLNAEVDKQGPVPLAAVATIPVTAPSPAAAASPSPSPSPDAAPAPEARIVVVGDSDFASNAMLDVQGNKDLFLNIVAWLAEDADLLSIRPRESEDQRLFLTAQEQRNVALFTLVLLPVAMIALGVTSWWRRR